MVMAGLSVLTTQYPSLFIPTDQDGQIPWKSPADDLERSNLRLTFKRAVLHVATRYLLRSSFIVALSLSLLLGGFEDLAEDAQLVTGVTQSEKRIHFYLVAILLI